MVIHKVGVVGAGLMGAGIAQTCAQSGYTVVVREINQQLLDKGLSRIYDAWSTMASKGKWTKITVVFMERSISPISPSVIW